MNNEYVPLKRAFELMHWEWKESEELFKCLSHSNKNDMWLYNYNDNHHVEINHPVLMRCRGLVIRGDGRILNYPFDRFFNDFQPEQANIDWSNAEVQEKVDGSLICVFWNDGGWEITTRGSFYPHENVDIDFSVLFEGKFDSFNKLDENVSYMFELVTVQNRIVKWYDDERVYLIGARNLQSVIEISQPELDVLAAEFGVLRPKRYVAKDIVECKKLFEGFEDDDEGLVVVDRNFNRLKVKQQSYFELSRIMMLNEQHIFEYVLGQIEIDGRYLSRLSGVKNNIEFVRAYWEHVKGECSRVFVGLKSKPSRKEFALEAMKYPFSRLLFTMLDGRQLDNRDEVGKLHLKWEIVSSWFPDVLRQLAIEYNI